MNVFNIAARELRSLFLSPLSWVVLAITQAFVAYAFLVKLELFLQLKPHLPGLPGAPGLTAIVVALFVMRIGAPTFTALCLAIVIAAVLDSVNVVATDVSVAT